MPAVNDDESLEKEADEMGSQAAKAADLATSALDQLKRLESRAVVLRKLLVTATQ